MNPMRRVLYLAARAYWIVAKPLTLGVRVMLVRGDEVLLVKHSYQRQWFVPGGLVERGETLAQAARREAREEVGAVLGPLALVGVFSNFAEGKSDHITVFACTDFTLTPTPNAEIERSGFFSPGALPEEVSPGTRRRIEAYARGEHSPAFGDW